MFTLASGYTIQKLTGVDEGFGNVSCEGLKCTLQINVSVENVREIFLGLAALVREPTFAFIDVPYSRDTHEKLNSPVANKRWADSYYRDKTSVEDLVRIFDHNAGLFTHDGMIKYGFACKVELDEVYVGKFKLFRVYTDSPQKYVDWLLAHGISKREPLRTVWDNVTNENPATSSRLTMNGEDVFALIKRLAPEGFVFNRHIED